MKPTNDTRNPQAAQDRWTLQISAGTGPVEVRRFVALLALRLESQFRGQGLEFQAPCWNGPEAAPSSVEILLQGDAPAQLRTWLGTHELLARSPGRGRASRKRWYAGVRLFPFVPQEAADATPLATEVRIRTSRAGGPGGQNVNKTETAVRAVHQPSGLSVRVTGQRSQHANRRVALLRLSQKLQQRVEVQAARQRADQRQAHTRLVRGAPVRRWILQPDGQNLSPAED